MVEIWRAEEHPSDPHDKQRIACAHDARRALKHRCDRGQPFKRQEQSMPQSPGDEIPARAMPCAGEEKHETQVPNRRPCAEAIAAERAVDVVAKPRRPGHVPAPPEAPYRGRGVGVLEIFWESEAEH